MVFALETGGASAEPESFNRPLAKAKANTADQPQQRHWQQSMLCHLLAAVLPTLWGMGRLANLPSQHCAPRTAQRLPLRYSSGASVDFFLESLETQQVGPSCAKKNVIQNWMPRPFYLDTYRSLFSVGWILGRCVPDSFCMFPCIRGVKPWDVFAQFRLTKAKVKKGKQCGYFY